MREVYQSKRFADGKGLPIKEGLPIKDKARGGNYGGRGRGSRRRPNVQVAAQNEVIGDRGGARNLLVVNPLDGQ